jgi:hypothetical protein
VPKQKPKTLPGHRTWWVVVACPQAGDEEDLKTWGIVYVSSNNTSTWDQIPQEAQPHVKGVKDFKVITLAGGDQTYDGEPQAAPLL